VNETNLEENGWYEKKTIKQENFEKDRNETTRKLTNMTQIIEYEKGECSQHYEIQEYEADL
jgi:hypothetical protein